MKQHYSYEINNEESKEEVLGELHSWMDKVVLATGLRAVIDVRIYANNQFVPPVAEASCEVEV